MSTLVYMKILEQNPSKYDRGMKILTLGRIDKIKKEIVSTWVKPDYDILEIGCGAGTLAAKMTERGSRVTGIDISEKMLAVARKNAPDAEFIHLTATEIDKLKENKFDCIVATLSFSELSEDELILVLQSSAVLLKEGGKLVVADEVLPDRWWKRIFTGLIHLPLAVITFLITQNTTHALKKFDERLRQSDFNVIFRKNYLLGTLALIVSEKK